MNAAILILASTLTGHHPAASSCNAPACCAPAPTCNTCDPCASPGWGHKLRGQLSGLFSCHSCKTECAPACATPAPAPCAAPAPTCCAPAASSCGCGHSWGGGNFLGKLRGRFGHSASSDCCTTAAPACNTCGGAAAPAAPGAAPAAPAGENIKEAPKKMPDAPKGDKAVFSEPTQDAPPLAIPAIPTVNPVSSSQPGVIAAPATLRNPF